MDCVHIIVLGNESAGDDGAALAACGRLGAGMQIVRAGRPGAALLDLLEPDVPTVLVDVTRGAGAPGLITSVPLKDLPRVVFAQSQFSSHGLGPAEVLRLAEALDRTLPPGFFVGIEGERFEPGVGLSRSVEENLESLLAAVREAVIRLMGGSG